MKTNLKTIAFVFALTACGTQEAATTNTTVGNPQASSQNQFFVKANLVDVGYSCVKIIFEDGVQKSAEPVDNSFCAKSQVVLAGQNGRDGQDGQDGLDGQDGASCDIQNQVLICGQNQVSFANLQFHQYMVKQTVVGSDYGCSSTGILIESGLDSNDNGSLGVDEVVDSNVVCDGAQGAQGAAGQNGTNGTNGVDGQDGVDAIEYVVLQGGGVIGTLFSSSPDMKSFVVRSHSTQNPETDMFVRYDSVRTGSVRMSGAENATIYYDSTFCNNPKFVGGANIPFRTNQILSLNQVAGDSNATLYRATGTTTATDGTYRSKRVNGVCSTVEYGTVTNAAIIVPYTETLVGDHDAVKAYDNLSIMQFTL